MPLGLPFDEVIVLDTEFIAPAGEVPRVVCLVAREVGSGRVHRCWVDDLGSEPPFRTDDRVLFVGYNLVAEWSCFLVLGWAIPRRSIDCYVEFLHETNGQHAPLGRSFLSALSQHGLASITKAEKDEMRERIMAGFPFSASERRAILDYCQSDVDPLVALFERMLPAIRSRPHGVLQAMHRARYMAAVARMEHTGIPIDVDTLDAIRSSWRDIQADLIAEVDTSFGVYEGTTFRSVRFRDYLRLEGIAWPIDRVTRRLKLDGDTFRDMAKVHPQIRPLQELRHSLAELRLESLAVGADGRNRTSLMPYRARTGRNQPSNSKFVFGPAKWIRSLITPEPGSALAYIDWTSQEVAIGAHLSGDPAMVEAVSSGDPYISFAIQAGMLPPGIRKHSGCSLPQCVVCTTRDVCKTVVLGVGYGMEAGTLAYRTGSHVIEAAELLRRVRAAWPTFFEWGRDNQSRAQLAGSIETVFGWRQIVVDGVSPRALLNFPMQANGAEMLRLACSTATEAGILVCAPVHDAVLIEAPVDLVHDVIAETQRHMSAASGVVLGGPTVGTDVEQLLLPGQRYSDKRGEAMWTNVMGLLGLPDRVGRVA